MRATWKPAAVHFNWTASVKLQKQFISNNQEAQLPLKKDLKWIMSLVPVLWRAQADLQIWKVRWKLSLSVLNLNMTVPGTWFHIIQECGIFQGAILMCIPLLAIKANDDTLAQKKRGPHNHIPNGPFSTVIKNEVENHSKAHEEAEEDWIEITKADS